MPEIQSSLVKPCSYKQTTFLFASLSLLFASIYLHVYGFPGVKPSGPHQASSQATSEPQLVLGRSCILVTTSSNSVMFMSSSWA